MPTISLNIGELESLRRTLQQRRDDLGDVRQRLGQTQRNLRLASGDRSAVNVSSRLDDVARLLTRAHLSLDDEQRRVAAFLTAMIALDARPLTSPALAPIGQWADRLRTGWAADTHRDIRFDAVAAGLRDVTLTTGILAVADLRVLRHSTQRRALPPEDQATSLTCWGTSPPASKRPESTTFWDGPDAVFKTVTKGLEEVGQRTLNASAKVADKVDQLAGVAWDAGKDIKLATEKLFAILGHRWETSLGNPNATVMSRDEGTAELEVTVPLPWKADLVLTPKVKYSRTVYDDGTVELTVNEEFKAALQAQLEAELGPDNKAEISAAVSAAFGRERTFRIQQGSLSGVPNEMAFLQQDVTRTALQILSSSGLSTAVVSRVALAQLPPAPEPTAHGYYVKLGAEVGAGLTLGGEGLKASGDASVELRYVKDSAADTAKLTIKASVGGDATIVSNAGNVSTAVEESRSVSVILDEHGRVTALEYERESTIDVSGGREAEFATPAVTGEVETNVGHKETTTTTTSIELTPEQRQRINTMMGASDTYQDPRKASGLVKEIANIARQGERTTTVEHSAYSYTSQKAEVGIDQAKITLTGEQRFNFKETP